MYNANLHSKKGAESALPYRPHFCTPAFILMTALILVPKDTKKTKTFLRASKVKKRDEQQQIKAIGNKKYYSFACLRNTVNPITNYPILVQQSVMVCQLSIK
jgi:hypothetical protein